MGGCTSSEPAILGIGDSFVSYSASSFEDTCIGSEVRNWAWSGTTAEQWGTDLALLFTTFLLMQEPPAGYDKFDKVWFSVGANDIKAETYREELCSGGGIDEAVFEHVEDALSNVETAIVVAEGYRLLTSNATNINSLAQVILSIGVEVVMVGYCQPTACAVQQLCGPDHSASLDLIAELNDGLKKVCEKGKFCTFVDSTEACGTNASSWASGDRFIDPKHLNEYGYCELLSDTAVQVGMVSWKRDTRWISSACDRKSCRRWHAAALLRRQIHIDWFGMVQWMCFVRMRWSALVLPRTAEPVSCPLTNRPMAARVTLRFHWTLRMAFKQCTDFLVKIWFPGFRILWPGLPKNKRSRARGLNRSHVIAVT